ncbi:MAG: dinitrogenase iron-molybdenum cofactor biosynthesis protein [Treponema sp.]|jgi:predicted Fe-Mo cluster-binding NifX family protein|nr:dinitrogenase iron-molybdenum cofactor biosynthesis protein [Treponema sp.]
MAWRVAVTSADGVLINQHFGHARWLFIYDVERDGTSALVERRTVDPWCTGRTGACSPGNAGIAGNMGDCIAVLTARIGPPARKELELAGISVFEEPSAIDGALRKLARYYSKTQKTGGPGSPQSAAGEPV